MAFDCQSGKAQEVVAQAGTAKGSGYVVRDQDGKVYGCHAGERDWYRFYQGAAEKIGRPERLIAKPIIAGSQGLFYPEFPDGSRLVECDLIDRVLTTKTAKSGEEKRVPFDYTSEGAHIMGVAAASNGTICGGTAFPMRFFSYDPKADAWVNRESYGQWNTVARQGNRFFAGGYGGGFLLEWDPAKVWVETVKGEGCNPQFLTECSPTIHRPHELLAHPDGKTLVLAGTPNYGYTGGGLLFWDRESSSQVLLEHTDLLPEHSTMSLAALPEGRLLGGTTTAAGTGGEQKAEVAELYLLDMATKKLQWHAPLLPGVQSYTDLGEGPKGLIYGMADSSRFFVLDPVRREIIHEEAVSARFGPSVSQQGPRVFVMGPDSTTYLLFAKGIGRVDPETFEITMIAESPIPIGLGGDFLGGRIYFGSGSHLYSYTLPK